MAEINDPLKRFKSLVTSLQKSVECPVCLEIVNIPFKQCARGHVVCLKCVTKLEKCSVCQGLFTLENPVCLKSILEALPHVCCYSDRGCEEVVEPGNNHELFCGFRLFVCMGGWPLACKVVSVNQLLDHFQIKNHKYIKEAESGHLNYIYNFKTHPNLNHRNWAFWLFDNWFWIILFDDKQEEQLKIFFKTTPIGKIKHDYYACMKLEQDKFSYSYTLKANVSLCERGGGIDVQSNLSGDQSCMRVPVSELPRFIRNDGRLQFHYSIFSD